MADRPYSHVIALLQEAGLRPTRQRMALARLLFENGDRHVTAEEIHAEATDAGVKVSVATVYNTLHQLTRAGLLREVVVDPGRTWFDTNTNAHHHFFYEDSGAIHDIAADQISIGTLPDIPAGTRLASVDVVVRVRSDDSEKN